MTYVRTVSRSGPEIPFQLTSVDETPAPDGCDGVWQRYVITQGANTIVGVRCGLHDEVTVQLDRRRGAASICASPKPCRRLKVRVAVPPNLHAQLRNPMTQ